MPVPAGKVRGQLLMTRVDSALIGKDGMNGMSGS